MAKWCLNPPTHKPLSQTPSGVIFFLFLPKRQAVIEVRGSSIVHSFTAGKSLLMSNLLPFLL